MPLILDYHFQWSCFFFHLCLIITDVIILLLCCCMYPPPPTERSEVRVNNRRLPGFGRDSASFSRTLKPWRWDACCRQDCPSEDPTARLLCSLSHRWLFQRGHLQYVHTYWGTFPAGADWSCADRSLFIKLLKVVKTCQFPETTQ